MGACAGTWATCWRARRRFESLIPNADRHSSAVRRYVRRYLGQLLEGEEALATLRRGVQLLQAAVDAQVRPWD